MLNRILTIGFACLFATVVFAGEINTTLCFNPLEISNVDNYNRVIVPGCLTIANLGEPMLPRYGISLLLPGGEEAVTIEYIYGERTKLEGVYNVEPGQRQYPLGYDGPIEETIPDPVIYNSNNKYPSTIESSLSTHYYRGHGMAFADICPIEYYPQSGELYYYDQIEVKVITQPSGKSLTAYHDFLRIDKRTNGRLANYIQNTSEIRSFYGQSSLNVDAEGSYDFLIITNEDMLEEVMVLADAKNGSGYLTEVMLVSTILADYTGIDDQDKIRNCIIDQYQNHGIEYVLLAGDDEIIPHRGLYSSANDEMSDDDIPADIYYSHLDGTWNDDYDDRR